MYCKNCGKQIGGGEICKDCQAILGTTVVSNGEKFDVVQEVNTNPNKISYSEDVYTNNNTYTNTTANSNQYSSQRNPNAKSKVAAGIFGILLGVFGVHNFYLGYTGKAIAQLLMTILSCGALSFISGLWGFIEGIIILTGGMTDANGNELVD